MPAYETSATVQAQGQIHVAGVPFAPGTEVAVTISPKLPSKTRTDDQPAGSALRWEGNVLVHQGVGAGPLVSELRDERLNRLAEGRAG